MEQKFKFELTEKEINIILDGLGEMKAKNSYSIINKIHKYFDEQIKNNIEIEKNEL